MYINIAIYILDRAQYSFTFYIIYVILFWLESHIILNISDNGLITLSSIIDPFARIRSHQYQGSMDYGLGSDHKKSERAINFIKVSFPKMCQSF